MLLLLLLIQCKISLYLELVRMVRPVWTVRCFVTPGLHTPLPKYPSGQQLLSRSRSRLKHLTKHYW